MSPSTVVVTGGAGFIGCAIAPGLLASVDRVIAVDSLHPQVHPTSMRPAALPAEVELVVGDVADGATWERVLEATGPGGPELIVHLAAETGTGQSLIQSSRHASANVLGTARMLDALASRGNRPRRIVLASSRAVYGEGAWRRTTGEDAGAVLHPAQRTTASLADAQWDVPGAEPLPMDSRTVRPNPVSVYAVTKLAQEQLLRVWASSFGVEAAILRLQNVYGPGQAMANPYTGIMTLFCRYAREGRSIPLYEDGQVRRDFVLIDDVAAAVLAATLGEAVSPDAIDIGSGQHQTIATAARAIARAYGAPEPHVTGAFREGDVRHAFADITQAREVLGWEPCHDLETGVARLVAWIEDQDEVPPLTA
ncbi:NAD-dependent epimerase/dehydratase family protein [Brachybacterium hainanense]|uniref:NAD-dependent epimerase/dehydratase family protein n=1 Tax=Brachybacterium hainanense TaxID=1541174 RepID=A0ABV6RGE5_9MICO